VSFTVAETPFAMKVGEEITLDASVEPIDATDKAVTWTSSKPEVATVDANGKVTAIAAGETTIKVATSNGKFYEQALTVSEAVLNTYLAWNADQKKLVATEIPATYTVVEDASMDVDWLAGTYVVEGQVTINGSIKLHGEVKLIIKDGAQLTVNGNINGDSNILRIYGQSQMPGELVVNCSDNDDAITDLSTLEVHSAKVTATSSASGCGGFYKIGTFNVYGGLVDAKGTATAEDGGYGICLKVGGSMNIWGGEVKAEGKGDSPFCGYGIMCMFSTDEYKAPVTVHGGKLWAGNADQKALNNISLTIDKSPSFNVEIQTSPDNSTWNPTVGTPDSKYVRVGY